MIKIKNPEASMAWRAYFDAKKKVKYNLKYLKEEKSIYIRWRDEHSKRIINERKNNLRKSIELCRYWKRMYKQYQTPNSKKYYKLNKTIKFR